MHNLQVKNQLSSSNRFSLFLFSAFLSLNFLFYVIYKVSDYFTGFGFNESVIYHVFYGIQGFDVSLYLSQLIYLSLFIILAIALFFIIPFKYLAHLRFKKTLNILLIVLLVFQPLTNNLFTLFGSSVFASSFIGKLNPQLNEAIKISSTKNIIYIYAESLEGTFFDESLFPGLLPNLSRLKQQGLVFSNITQTYGTGNTIAGMVASQCGVPFDANGINGPENPFLPRLYCLGDILSENGYYLSYLGGAFLDFAGKGNFYKTHGFDSVIGRKKLAAGLTDPNYQSKWGIYDDTMFEQAESELARLYAQNQKFGLFLLTLDTHYPDHIPSKICSEFEYADGKDSHLNTIHCSDSQIANFVAHIMSSPRFDDTLIIIASDHLSPYSDLFKNKRSIRQRKDMVIVLDKDIGQGEVVKAGSMLDVLPTLLQLMGADINQHNLGFSLLGPHKTFTETEQDLSKLLMGWSYQLKKFN